SIAAAPVPCCNPGVNPFFTESLWPGLSAWILLYISDYSLTVHCARLYQERVRDKVALEGSYEITPYYQRDIDTLKRISPRFLAAMAGISAFLALIRYGTAGTPIGGMIYEFFLGVLILTQLAVHVRHLRNVVTFHIGFGDDGVRGHIEYPRWLTLRTSAAEL